MASSILLRVFAIAFLFAVPTHAARPEATEGESETATNSLKKSARLKRRRSLARGMEMLGVGEECQAILSDSPNQAGIQKLKDCVGALEGYASTVRDHEAQSVVAHQKYREAFIQTYMLLKSVLGKNKELHRFRETFMRNQTKAGTYLEGELNKVKESVANIGKSIGSSALLEMQHEMKDSNGDVVSDTDADTDISSDDVVGDTATEDDTASDSKGDKEQPENADEGSDSEESEGVEDAEKLIRNSGEEDKEKSDANSIKTGGFHSMHRRPRAEIDPNSMKTEDINSIDDVDPVSILEAAADGHLVHHDFNQRAMQREAAHRLEGNWPSRAIQREAAQGY